MEIASPNVSQGMQQDSSVSGIQSGVAGATNGHVSMAAAFAAAIEAERPPTWQLDLMMEKLRQKSNQLKPLMETAKNIRMALQERRYFLDQGDRLHLQKCLDTLQQSIKVSSLQSMVERLEMVSRQLGLKFTPGATGNEWFISSDMFYLELLIDQSGVVQEVKIQHDGKTEQQSVPEMVSCLRKNDFADFTAHLEGLVAIYQLNADKKIKSKAFIALQALESDLLAMASTYAHMKDGEAIVMKSLLGLIQPRKGGHPVKLTYFISPYEFLDVNSKVTLPSDVDTIIEKKLGNVATVCIQGSTSRKLQMSTTVAIVRGPDGKNYPRYGTLNATNSTALPACFTVNLGKPIPICKQLLQIIQNGTGIHCFDFSSPQPILSLITQHYSGGTLDCTNNKGLFVALPDTPQTLQVHCYFMTETPNLEGILVSSINFTLASQLPQVVSILRQQLIFNTLIGSCVRVGSKPDMDCMVFEVNALSHQNVSVSFQHPLEDSLVTLEFDLRDVSHPVCRLHAVTNAADIIPTLEEHACKVVQRSLSIPITVRAVIRRWQTMKSKFEPPNPEFNIPVGGGFGADSMNQLQSNEISCAAESERTHNQQQTTQQNSMVPGMVMGLSNTLENNNNNNNNAGALHSNSVSSSGRHPSGSGNSSYTISPVQQPNNGPLNNFAAPSPTQQNQQQNPMELLSSYMNPLFLSNQLGNLGGSLPANFPNLGGLTLQNLSGLLDQVGQRGRRRKRKGTSSDSTPIPPLPGGGMNIQGNPNVPRPSPSPSPKSPRQMFPNKSPKRRPSEGSDMSDTSQDSRATTPQTPLTPHGSNSGGNSALNLFMSEMGLEMPDPRWNIDITPVSTAGNANQNVTQAMENFLASKLLSGFSSVAAAAAAANSNPNQSSSVGDFHMELDSDEADGSNEFGNKFSVPHSKKVSNKKPRDFPKRSISLDSHSGASGEENNISSNLQSFLNASANSAPGETTEFKPLVTPSLSITPVPTNSTSSQSAVNSLLANMRTGIEIIPLPNPHSVQIPNSITVTPINPKSTTQVTDKDGNGNNGKKAMIISKDIKKEDSSNPEGTTTIKKKLGPVSDANNKKDRKRKASNAVPPLLDEDGLPVHDFTAKQPKLLPFGNISAAGTTSITSVTDKKSGMSVSLKNTSPPFGLASMKKPGSPSINRAPTPNKTGSSPTPKIGGKPSVSAMKSVSGSPKYPDISSLQSSSSTKKSSKERKGSSNNSGFQGNAKIAKNLSLVGNPAAVANIMPNLKSLTDGSLPLSLASLNPGLLGVPNNSTLKTEANMAEALIKANLLSKGVMDAAKAQMQGNQSTSTQLAQATAAVVAAQIQRSNSTGSGSNSGGGGGGGTGGGGGATTGKKVGNLLAVIDKLRSSQSVSGDESKKDMGKVDYIKASSGMTSDVMQLKKSQSTGSGSLSSSSGATDSGSSGGNSQYVVKPGQPGGLKMTLGKTKSAPSLAGSKEKTKSSMKSSGSKKSSFSGLKPPTLSSATMGSAGSNTTKPVPSLSSIGPASKKTSSSSSSSSGSSSSSSKDKEKDSREKSSKSQTTGNGNSASNSSRKTSGPEDEVDLTRKLFMPGGLDAPKFDITKYQIPKKSSSSSSSSSSNTPLPPGSTTESSPKNTAPSPSSTPTKSEKDSASLKDEKEIIKTSVVSESREKGEATSSLSSTMIDIPPPITSASGSTVLISSSVEKSSTPAAPSTEPTKIKLSSASIGSSENFMEEMNKLFPSKGSYSASSPVNLSSSSGMISKPAIIPTEPTVSVGEPDSTTNETPLAPVAKEESKKEDVKSSPPSAPAASLGSFTSPESPEPCAPEETNKATLTIPTTPQATSVPTPEETPVIPTTVAASSKQSPLPSPDEDDQLTIDLEKKATEGVSSATSAAKQTSSSSSSKDESTKSTTMSSTTSEMPPPPAPDSTSAAFTVPSSTTPIVTSAASSVPSAPVGSPIPSSIPTPPPPPATATVPIVSVHIVHSPQPNSPALLRSPLVVQSPHSSHASPYPIDDDLMDEALIGTGK